MLAPLPRRRKNETLSKLDASLFSGPKPRKTVAIKGPVVPQTEVKYVDLAVAGYAADTTGTITPLNLIAQGVDNTQRIGREALMLGVAIRGLCVPTTGTATGPQMFRLALVWDNATDGVLPAITDVFTAATAYAFPNVSNIGRFTILHDQLFGIGPLTAALADKTTGVVDVTLKINSATRFSGTTAAIASMQDGTLYAITLGVNAAGAAAGSIFYQSRVSYLDS